MAFATFVVRKSFVSVLLSADSFEESFALKFVQQAHIQSGSEECEGRIWLIAYGIWLEPYALSHTL